MSKEQKSNKENKKKPAMTPKEKKAAKKAKKGAMKQLHGSFRLNETNKIDEFQ